jgi:hypothetical protein
MDGLLYLFTISSHCITFNKQFEPPELLNFISLQMTIKVTIKANSKAAEVFKKYMAEKKALREAAANGNYVEYCKKNNLKFDTPVDFPESPLSLV